MLSDNGFQLTKDNDVNVSAFIWETVDELGWKLFCDVWSFFDKGIVREFYSHFNLSIVTALHVWKKELFLTSLVKNDLFDLPNIENDDYSTNVNVEMIQDALRIITIVGTK